MSDEFAQNAVTHAQALVACESVTPAEGGALDYLQGVLGSAGFECTRLPFKLDDGPEVDNLFARFGTGEPHICFAGHTDVVPVGDSGAWTHAPFGAKIVDGVMYGRGTSDMKGGIAAFVAAACAAVDAGDVPGSLSFLITGDEEGPAVNGTKPVLAWMADNGHTPDHCLVGEPTNPDALGDAMKIGRRGSLNITIQVRGQQGHVAYQHLANNALAGLIRVLADLQGRVLDEGTEHFLPSNLEVTNVDVGNTAVNIIPARATGRLNIRYNDLHTEASLRALVDGWVSEALDGSGLTHDIAYKCSGDAFRTDPGELTGALSAAVEHISGRQPKLSTSGGTSDARFIKDYCPVIEYGLTNGTIHQVDECARVDDICDLAQTYRAFLANYFEAFGASAGG